MDLRRVAVSQTKVVVSHRGVAVSHNGIALRRTGLGFKQIRLAVRHSGNAVVYFVMAASLVGVATQTPG